jgi:hypothetical protein
MDYQAAAAKLTMLVKWTANAERVAKNLEAQGAHVGAKWYRELARLYFVQYQALQQATGL